MHRKAGSRSLADDVWPPAGSITSLTLESTSSGRGGDFSFLVGTSACELFRVQCTPQVRRGRLAAQPCRAAEVPWPDSRHSRPDTAGTAVPVASSVSVTAVLLGALTSGCPYVQQALCTGSHTEWKRLCRATGRGWRSCRTGQTSLMLHSRASLGYSERESTSAGTVCRGLAATLNHMTQRSAGQGAAARAAAGSTRRDSQGPGVALLSTDQQLVGAVQGKELRPELLQTAHSQKITDLAFPHQYSEVFATCSFGEIRVWHLHSRRELLRISVPNLGCTCVAFMQVGGSPVPPQAAMPCQPCSLCSPVESMPRK